MIFFVDELKRIKRGVLGADENCFDISGTHDSCNVDDESYENVPNTFFTQNHDEEPIPTDIDDELKGIKRKLVWNQCVQTYQLDKTRNKQNENPSLHRLDSRSVIKENKHSCLICAKTFKVEHSLLQHVFDKHKQSEDEKYEPDKKLCLRRVCYNDVAERKVKHRRYTPKHYVKNAERYVKVNDNSGHLNIIIKQKQGSNIHSHSHII